MFRLYDMRTGQAAAVAVRPAGVLRLFVAGPPANRTAHAGDLRRFLLADLVRRNAEHRHDLAVVATLVVDEDSGAAAGSGEPGAGAGHHEAFSAEVAALNIRAPEQSAGISAVADPIASHEVVVGTIRAGAGPVRFGGHGADSSGLGGGPQTALLIRLAELGERGLDPLALRLAYLSVHYREQADLSWDTLSDADRELRRWRQHVAEWAESPSKPMCAQVTAQVAAAFDDDLDTPAALRALRVLAQDPDIPPGSKFESVLHADQLLALDLPQEIGRWSPPQRNNSSS